MSQPKNYNDTVPAAPTGEVNVAWQADVINPDPTVVRNVSAYMPKMTATTPGAVPVPPNDPTKFLNGQGAFTVPPPPPDMTNVVGGSVPTPPNDATKYLDGTGHFTVPAGGGGGGGSALVQVNGVDVSDDYLILVNADFALGAPDLGILVNGA